MNSRTIRLGIMMLFQYAIWGAWTTSLMPHLEKLEFTGSQIAAIYGCLWLACMIAPFIGGQFVDRLIPTQIFLGAAHLLGAACLCVTALQTNFLPMWTWMFLYSLLYAPTLPLTNSLAFHHLRDAEGQFGRIRVWGTIGWILAGWLVFLIRTTWHTETWTNRSDLLLIAAGLSFLMGLFCFALPHTPPKKESSSPLAFLEALSMLKDKNFLLFILCSFVVTTELQFYYVPTAGFLRDLGMSEAKVPAALTLAQIAEILVLIFLLHLSLKKLGVRKTMLIGILAWPLRYFLFAVPLLPIILASLTLHGFGYAFFFVASQVYVNEKATDDMRASAQALLTFFTLGLGNYLGTLFTGFCMDYFKRPEGMAWTQFFLVPAGITVVVAIVFLFFFRDDVRPEKKA